MLDNYWTNTLTITLSLPPLYQSWVDNLIQQESFLLNIRIRYFLELMGEHFLLKDETVEKFYQAYFEFLETNNEYIDYPLKGAINQGNWEIYGIGLPDSGPTKNIL